MDFYLVYLLRNMFVQTKMRLKEGTKIKLQRDISQIGLQVAYCRLFAVFLQVVYSLLTGYLQSGIHVLTFSVILCFL